MGAREENSIRALKERCVMLEHSARERDRVESERILTDEAAKAATALAKANTEQVAALDAEIETTRRGAWSRHILDTSIATAPGAPFDLTAALGSIPKFGWPPGDGPDRYHFTNHVGQTLAIEDAAQTPLGRAMAARMAPRRAS